MTLEITGKLIEKYETLVVSERFKKREFVLELVEEINGSPWTNYAKMQLVQNKCEILDRFELGDMLRVNFNIKGNRYEKEGKTSYFSNLDAWRLEKADANGSPANSQGNSYNGANNSNSGYGNTNSNAGYNSNPGGNWNNNNNSGFQNSGNPAAPQPASSPDASDDLPF